MLASSLIIKKRDGGVLTNDEIAFLVDGFCRGEVTDYQMSALAMAICIRGMNQTETATLTGAMLESGEVLPRDGSVGSGDRPRVDKHSTGGLGDKVSLILAPLLASCEVEVPMISGRGLGITGGTLDKLESISGFQTEFSLDQSTRLLEQSGTFIIAANEQIAPADRSLYALRDVTGTVESVPLITASILSKKLAANLDGLVMDVKCGAGALMKNLDDASALAKSLVQVGHQAGLPTSALITDMNQPLGSTVGNAIEVSEALEVLDGKINDVRGLTLELAAELLIRIGHQPDLPAAMALLESNLDSGQAMERFEKMVAAQGGDLKQPLHLAPGKTLESGQSGYLKSIDCQALGEVIVAARGGRRRKGDSIDHSVGIELHVRLGDKVDVGERILTFHAPSGVWDDYAGRLRGAFEFSVDRVRPSPLILSRVSLSEVSQHDGDKIG